MFEFVGSTVAIFFLVNKTQRMSFVLSPVSSFCSFILYLRERKKKKRLLQGCVPLCRVCLVRSPLGNREPSSVNVTQSGRGSFIEKHKLNENKSSVHRTRSETAIPCTYRGRGGEETGRLTDISDRVLRDRLQLLH